MKPNIHGIGPDTDGGPNPDYVPPVPPEAAPLPKETLEQLVARMSRASRWQVTEAAFKLGLRSCSTALAAAQQERDEWKEVAQFNDKLTLDYEDKLTAAETELEQARKERDVAQAEIAEAREACPAVRMQDNLDAPLLKLINLEVSRGFNRDALVYKLQAELEQARKERDATVGKLQEPDVYLRKALEELERARKDRDEWKELTIRNEQDLSTAVHVAEQKAEQLTAEVTRLKELCYTRDVEIGRLTAHVEDKRQTLLAIAAAVNAYYNNEDKLDALTAFRALRAIADALGKPMEGASQ